MYVIYTHYRPVREKITVVIMKTTRGTDNHATAQGGGLGHHRVIQKSNSFQTEHLYVTSHK